MSSVVDNLKTIVRVLEAMDEAGCKYDVTSIKPDVLETPINEVYMPSGLSGLVALNMHSRDAIQHYLTATYPYERIVMVDGVVFYSDFRTREEAERGEDDENNHI